LLDAGDPRNARENFPSLGIDDVDRVVAGVGDIEEVAAPIEGEEIEERLGRVGGELDVAAVAQGKVESVSALRWSDVRMADIIVDRACLPGRRRKGSAELSPFVPPLLTASIWRSSV